MWAEACWFLESEDSTIYHYTLLYRFTRKHPFFWVYSACMLLWAFADAVYSGWEGLLQLAASVVIVTVVHAAIVLPLTRLSRGSVPRIWKWAFAYPLAGYLPAGLVPIKQWDRANHHRLLIGFVLVALLYVWLPLPWLANAAAAHYFLLLPQLVYVGKCLRLHTSGMLKVTEGDISFYKN
jgi:hypothetical protein